MIQISSVITLLLLILPVGLILSITSCSRADNLSSEMILIPAGEFTLGRTIVEDDAWYPNYYDIESELPAHKIFVESFYIDKYETTVESFELFLKDTKRKYPETFKYPHYYKRGYPATSMTWRGAYDYCKWAGKRLLTEVEWERAARGDDNRIYPWGNEWDYNKLNYGYREYSKPAKDPYEYTSPVDRFTEGASPYGVMDMAGNTWEWTSSQYRPYPYVKDDGREDFPERGVDVSMTARGGAFDSRGGQLYTFHRIHPYTPDFGFDLGIRCGKDVEPVENK